MGDYISRETAMSMPWANGQYDHEHANEHFICGLETYKEWLEQIPAADVRPVVEADWKKVNGAFWCSRCGTMEKGATRRKHQNYCHFCGADMRHAKIIYCCGEGKK